MNVLESILARRGELIAILNHHGASNPRVFGSVARGDETGSSDLDLLVDMDAGRSLLDLIALQQEIQSALGRPIDVLTPGSLNRHIKERILAEARPL